MDPNALSLDTLLGPWRVVRFQGQGSYGAVYRVEREAPTGDGPFALKLALHPLDPRFEREGELLSRIRHPHVPRLLDRGWRVLSGGVPFPYLVMEWVEGTPLYAWAAQQERTSRQVCQLLAQVARALEATHAVEGVHRDVKGDNVLVRQDGSAVLTDLGSGCYRGAETLTHQFPPPGTPQYQSPECQRFQWEARHLPRARYEAQPADDVYALGVTAYRLVVGKYPPECVAMKQTEEGFQFVPVEPVAPERQVRLSPELAALIRQMLSDEPSFRGSAAEVAQALEHAAKRSGPWADQPIRPVSEPVPDGMARVSKDAESPVDESPPPVSVPVSEGPEHRLRSLRSERTAVRGLMAAASVCLLLGGVWWMESQVAWETYPGESESLGGLTDAGPLNAASEVASQSEQNTVNLDVPQKPFPGQGLPPCEKHEVEINKGCWVRSADKTPPCGIRSYAWRNSCYSPILQLGRPPSSVQP
ncbi:serine/threonine protein kinase [Stigmatella aurantiaca]|uniref:non-specific serine/threonine protein kinase n=1 Tax=Stigmatella aurantiaca (strain DW4/3-1) TaxID=378806 RepID=E3FPX5_STIAD|nr:serine/threonine-protein kinase [Stigmatella aurantiaca]ADO75678.1 Protein kinase [Stigmatella aurantiaca DW4/3-1]